MTVSWKHAAGLAIALELFGLVDLIRIVQESRTGLHPSSQEFIVDGITTTLVVWLVVSLLIAILALVVGRYRSALLAFAALTPLVYGALVGPLLGGLGSGVAFLLAGVVLGMTVLKTRELRPLGDHFWIGVGCWIAFTAVAVAIVFYLGSQYRWPLGYI